MKTKPGLFFLTAILSFFVVLAQGRSLGGQTIDIQSPPTSSYKLDNGLEVIVREDHSSPIVALQLWVKAGSIYEEDHLGAGISHFVEHLAFKGPEEAEEGELAREVQRLGGEVNASTSFDHTIFYISLPSEHWRAGLKLLRKLVLEVSFAPEEIERERKVILKEINMGLDDPDRRLNRLLWSTAFRIHPYRFPVIGYEELFKRLTPEDVRNYYDKWYIPNNMFLVVAGDVRGDKIQKAVAEIFQPHRRKTYPLISVPPEPAQVSRRVAEEEMDVAVARISLGFHIVSLDDPDLYPLDVLAVLLGQGRSSSLYRRVREEKELVHSIYAYSYTPAYPGLFVIKAVADAENLDSVQAAIREVIREYLETEVSEEELERARRKVISDYLSLLTTVEGQARDIGASQLLTGGWDFSRDYVEYISKVAPEDIKRVVRTYLNERNLTVVVIRPHRPAPVAVATPDHAQDDIRKFELKNGLTLLIREDHTLPLISIRMVFQGGVLAEDAANSGISTLCSRMLFKGTKNRSGEEIGREIENQGGAIGTYSGRNSFGCSLEIISDQMGTALKVLGDVLKNCTFSPEEMEKERKILLAQIKAEKDRPQGLAWCRLRQILFASHPYRFSVLGSEESVKNLNRETLVNFYNRYCCGENGVLAVFGDVNTQALLPLVEAELGTLRKGQKAWLSRRFKASLPEVKLVVESKKDIQQSVVMLGYPGVSVSDPNRYPLAILSSIFSGLSSPLLTNVRAKKGLVYYIGAYQILGLDPGGFIFSAGTVPDGVDVVLTGIRDEIKRVKEEGVSKEELQRNKNQLIGQHQFKLQANREQALQAALDQLYGLGYRNYQEYASRIEAVTARDLRIVAQEYFPDDDYTLAIVGPQEGGGNQ